MLVSRLRTAELNDVVRHDVRVVLTVLVTAFVTNLDGLVSGSLEFLLRIEERVARFGRRLLVEIAFGMGLLLGGIAQLVDGVDFVF